MNYVLFRGTHSSVIMNRNFYNNGHLLIVQHTYGFDIEKLPVKKDRCPHEGHTAFVKMLKHVLSHDGCNAGDNIAKSAGPCTCMCRWFHLERRYDIYEVFDNTRVIPRLLDEILRNAEPGF